MRDTKAFEDIDYMACFTIGGKEKTGFEADERSYTSSGEKYTIDDWVNRYKILDINYPTLQNCINKFDNIHNYPYNN